MIPPKNHAKEEKRLLDLESHSILDTIPENDFDYLTSIAAQICNTPISLVSLIDDKRQWFKSHHGLNVSETPKEYAFCGHAINEPDKILIVPDSRKDERFHDNPLVTGEPKVIFYAGVPLISEDGYPLGTLCVIDNEPKVLNEDQIHSLKALSNQVMRLITLRKNKQELEQSLKNLENKNSELEQFAYIASHDLREPLNTITSFIELLEEDSKEDLTELKKQSFRFINGASSRMKDLIKGLLDYSRLGKKGNIDKIDCNTLINNVIEDLNSCISESKAIIKIEKFPTLNAYENELRILFQNLICNAIKFTNPDKTPNIIISSKEDKDHWQFSIKDNGIGIDEVYRDKVFIIFQRLHNRNEYDGIGIGLAQSKKIAQLHNGDIWFDSEIGLGTTFHFTINKNIKRHEKD